MKTIHPIGATVGIISLCAYNVAQYGAKSGSKLGPYEIQSPLGAGGMGEVYRALDTRLQRSVAIKILPSQLSENSEAKQRLEREAKAISALNHQTSALFTMLVRRMASISW